MPADCLDPARFRALAGLAATPPDGAAVRELRRRATLSRADACAWLGVHRTTLARLERGETRAALGQVHLLAVLAGVLPFAAWAGWSVRAGALVSPDDARQRYTVPEIAMVTFAWQIAGAARAELRRRGTPEAEVRARLPQWGERGG